MWIRMKTLAWVRNAGLLEQINRCSHTIRFGDQGLIYLHCFDNLIAYGKQGVQCRHGLLKDHGNLAPTNVSNILNGEREKIYWG